MKLAHKMSFLGFVVQLAALAQISSFQHIVVIVQENRTPDNLFQGLCTPPYGTPASCSTTPAPDQYDIQTSNWLNKEPSRGFTQPVPVVLASNFCPEPQHADFVAMCDADAITGVCKMDGAAGVACSGHCPALPPFYYVGNSNGILNPYLEIATQYGWANYMFQTNQGASYPSHQFIFGGTSAPSAADDTAGIFVAENLPENQKAGCIAPAGTTVLAIYPDGSEMGVSPCFEHNTMADMLPSGVTWRYYAPSAGSIWTAPNSIGHLCQSSGPNGQCTAQPWTDNVDLTPADVLKDIGACKLRSLSWVIPTGYNSDHPWNNDGGGPSWVASIVNQIGASAKCDGGEGYWKNTAILITWDDWGGWYDHEPPPVLSQPQGDYQYGFRVPFLFVSAYTSRGLINNKRLDFGSMLRFIEHNFSLPAGVLNFADARAANGLGEFFKLSSAPRPFKTISAPKDATFFLNDPRPATDPDDE